MLRLHVIPALGRLQLTRVKPTDLTKLYAKLLGSGLSPMSVTHIHKLIHGMMKSAYRWDYVARNVVDLVAAPKATKRDVPVFSVEEAKRFIAAARDDELEALFVIAATCGPRSGELLGLTWDSVDIENQTMRIDKALQYQNGQPKLVEPKTPSSVRTISLSRMAATSLRRHRAKQDARAIALGAAWQNDLNLVFTNTVGSPLDRHNVLKRRLRPLLRKAGLNEALRFHDLRHIAASLALQQAIPVIKVSEMLGHSSTATVQSVYGHVIPGEQRQIADAMDRLLA
jgi:integrase